MSISKTTTIQWKVGYAFCLHMFLVLAAFKSPLWAQITYETVALSGLPSPGTAPGVNYGSFLLPTINAAGHVGFKSFLNGPGVVPLVNRVGVFSTDGDSQSLVFREGDPAPGFFGNVTLDGQDFFLGPFVQDTGDSTFLTSLEGDGINSGNNEAIFHRTSNQLQLTALLGAPAPDAGAGAVFSTFGSMASNAQGVSALSVVLSGAGVNPSNDRGLYSLYGDGTENRLVARKGQQAPGAGPGNFFDGVFVFPKINDAGQVGFISSLNAGAGIFLDTAGDLQPVVLSGTAAPDAPAGTNFNDFSRFSLNSFGEASFQSSINGPAGVQQGIYSTNGGLHSVAVSGQQAPGLLLAPEFSDFIENLINDTGEVAILATIDGLGITSDNDVVVYKFAGDELQLVARQNALIPGAADDVRFGFPSALHLNDSGQVAFFTPLQGDDIDTTNDYALFAESAGQLQLIAREGDLFDVDPDPMVDDLREIDFISVAPSAGPHDGRRLAFNAAGQLAFTLEFTDGSSGIFVAETGLPGDYNANGVVDAADYTVWRDNVGAPAGALANDADGGPIGPAQYVTWKANYGLGQATVDAAAFTAVPEPTALPLVLQAALLAGAARWKRP